MSESIVEFVRRTLAESPEAHPSVVAERVIAELPKHRRGEALSVAMVELVRKVAMSPTRGQTVRDTHVRSASGGRSHSESTAHVREMGKARAAAWLRQRVTLGDGQYRFLGDCTADECEVLAQIRRDHAKATVQRADWFEDLARRVREAGVARVADLPVELLPEAA